MQVHINSAFARFLPALFLLGACGERSTEGSGTTTTQTRTVAAFNAIEVAGSTPVEIFPAAAPRVEISGFENLAAIYESSVENGTLLLHFKEGHTAIRNNNLRVRVYGPGVARISTSGSGGVRVHHGAATLVREAAVNGSGNIRLQQADVPALLLSIAGSGDIHAQDARAARVTADIAGSGNIETTATELLEADIAGSGDVHYWGAPQVKKEVAGSGSLVQH